jgi:hypothetical protein
MKQDASYLIVEDIPLDSTGERVIKKDQKLYRTHGCYYLEGGLLDPYYQDQFDRLIDYETANGFKYLEKIS